MAGRSARAGPIQRLPLGHDEATFPQQMLDEFTRSFHAAVTELVETGIPGSKAANDFDEAVKRLTPPRSQRGQQSIRAAVATQSGSREAALASLRWNYGDTETAVRRTFLLCVWPREVDELLTQLKVAGHADLADKWQKFVLHGVVPKDYWITDAGTDVELLPGVADNQRPSIWKLQETTYQRLLDTRNAFSSAMNSGRHRDSRARPPCLDLHNALVKRVARNIHERLQLPTRRSATDPKQRLLSVLRAYAPSGQPAGSDEMAALLMYFVTRIVRQARKNREGSLFSALKSTYGPAQRNLRPGGVE